MRKKGRKKGGETICFTDCGHSKKQHFLGQGRKSGEGGFGARSHWSFARKGKGGGGKKKDSLLRSKKNAV